ncbi:hypothetical protein CYMTET_49071 [Cymbomonas tetramitiformis]|uniref:MULE transposase domain-containing protein n=1 Tax=Cymbomonas tetramitiformis TaxID=36881 RepID=A0AAE0BQY2_9CHLO|nr:hypothetical protein CYMTET_49071 [Cymbomonas tetramitiformis]
MLARLPSLAQIENFKKNIVRRATGAIKIERVADLVELTKGLELTAASAAFETVDVNAVVVLPNGVFDCGAAFGFVFSSRNILRNAERARDAWGGKFPGECDGSWKLLYCGWPILGFGTHHVYYDSKKCAIRHQFRPISFMFTKGESKEAFVRLFQCTSAAVFLLFGFKMDLSTCCSDKADAIKAAFATVWPNARWITCWPHISMKPRKEWVKLVVSADKTAVIEACDRSLHLLHKCRSTDQFGQLAKLVNYQLRNKFKEESLAHLVQSEYISPPYDVWYVTASGQILCDPSSQPIETYWFGVKHFKINRLRARLDNMMHEGLPQWLYLDATNGLCDPINANACGVVSSEVIAAAVDKLNAKAYKRVCRHYYVITKRARDVEVTTERVRDCYDSSKSGDLVVRVQLSIDSFVEKYMSLHKVEYINDKWVCDCKRLLAWWRVLALAPSSTLGAEAGPAAAQCQPPSP